MTAGGAGPSQGASDAPSDAPCCLILTMCGVFLHLSKRAREGATRRKPRTSQYGRNGLQHQSQYLYRVRENDGAGDTAVAQVTNVFRMAASSTRQPSLRRWNTPRNPKTSTRKRSVQLRAIDKIFSHEVISPLHRRTLVALDLYH